MEELNEEQLNELNEISELPQEEQRLKLQQFMSNLTPEQIEYLKKSQTQQCPFCLISQNLIKSYKIYEDDFRIAVLDINPATNGHVILFTKNHYKSSFEMSENEGREFFNLANNIAKELMKIIKAEGVNIYLANGEIAGQRTDHFILNIIPRFKNDGLNFIWNNKKLNERDADKIIKTFSNSFRKEVKQDRPERKITFRNKVRIP